MNSRRHASIGGKLAWASSIVLRHGISLALVAILRPALAEAAAATPSVTELTHTPVAPTDGDDLLVTARVSPTSASVVMTYRINYEANVSVRMFDDGVHEDGGAADGVFAAIIPASVSAPGDMVRYYVDATDGTGSTTRAPLFDDPNATPEYQGVVVATTNVETSLPQLFWFVEQPLAAEGSEGTRSSLFFRGVLYDNVHVRVRGGTSLGWPKKNFKVKFNDGFHFRFADGAGRVDEINLNATYTDKSYNRSVLAYESLRDAGIPAPQTFHVHVRQNGRFHSVALLTEQIDGDFLKRWELGRDGALYKAGPGSTYEDADAFEAKGSTAASSEALQALLTKLGSRGTALESFVFDNVDVPAMVNYMAGMAVIQNIDGSDKNHFLYRDSQGAREWRMLPYDLDLTFGPNALNTDVMVYDQQNRFGDGYASHPFIGARPYLLHEGKYNRFLEAIVNTERTRKMLLRRLRSLTETQLGSDYFSSKIDDLVERLEPDVRADREKWGASGAFSGETYTLAEANSRLKSEYLVPRLGFLQGTDIVGVLTDNPSSQPAAPMMAIGTARASAEGTQDAYLTLVNPNDFDVDVSGWRIVGDVSFTCRPGTVLLAGETLHIAENVQAFRSRSVSPKGGESRFVQGNYAGKLDAGGGSLTLTTSDSIVIATLDYAGMPTPEGPDESLPEVPTEPTAGAPNEPTAGAPNEPPGEPGSKLGKGSSSARGGCSVGPLPPSRDDYAMLFVSLLGPVLLRRRRGN